MRLVALRHIWGVLAVETLVLGRGLSKILTAGTVPPCSLKEALIGRLTAPCFRVLRRSSTPVSGVDLGTQPLPIVSLTVKCRAWAAALQSGNSYVGPPGDEPGGAR